MKPAENRLASSGGCGTLPTQPNDQPTPDLPLKMPPELPRSPAAESPPQKQSSPPRPASRQPSFQPTPSPSPSRQFARLSPTGGDPPRPCQSTSADRSRPPSCDLNRRNTLCTAEIQQLSKRNQANAAAADKSGLLLANTMPTAARTAAAQDQMRSLFPATAGDDDCVVEKVRLGAHSPGFPGAPHSQRRPSRPNSRRSAEPPGARSPSANKPPEQKPPMLAAGPMVGPVMSQQFGLPMGPAIGLPMGATLGQSLAQPMSAQSSQPSSRPNTSRSPRSTGAPAEPSLPMMSPFMPPMFDPMFAPNSKRTFLHPSHNFSKFLYYLFLITLNLLNLASASVCASWPGATFDRSRRVFLA